MEHFYIITNRTKDPEYKVTAKIRDYLIENGKKCSVQMQDEEIVAGKYTDASVVPEDIDCVIVLGGDGTLLGAASDLVSREVPFLGINLGTLGFLAEVKKDDFKEALKKVLAGEFEIEKRMMLEGQIYNSVERKNRIMALNDIIITWKGSLKIIHFSISVNGQFLHRYHADGMIVATPTGSTGYSLSAGGPVVDPKAKMIVLTPICPHSMQNRSIVLSPDDEITIEIEADYEGANREVEAIFDGSHRVSLCAGDKIVIQQSDKTTGIVKLSKVSFLENLHKKMKD